MAPTAGKFQSRGEDFIEFQDSQGQTKAKVDFQGQVHTTGIQFSDGTTQTSAGVALPSDVDCGVAP